MKNLGMTYRNRAEVVESELAAYSADTFRSISPLGSAMAERIARETLVFLRSLAPALTAEKSLSEPLLLDWIREFQEFKSCEYDRLRLGVAGSTLTGSLLWLWLFCRLLEPEVYAECGVFVGSSLFTARHACKVAEIHGFAPNLTNLAFRDGSIFLHACDWSLEPLGIHGKRALCCFDDHIDCAQRIREAHAMGFRNLIFDDCPDIGGFHRYRFIGLPTVPLILDQKLADGESVDWYHPPSKKNLINTFRADHVAGVREVIDFATSIPSLESKFGLVTHEQWFVRLKS